MIGAELAIVIFIGLGFGVISGLATGDKQWQHYTDKGICDSKHKIVTFVPKITETGVKRIRFVVPCNEWFPKR